MFFDGHDIADAMTLLAAVKFHRQDIAKTGRLVRSTDALTGFRKLDPPQRHNCLCPMLEAIVRRLWRIKLQVAMWLLVV